MRCDPSWVKSPRRVRFPDVRLVSPEPVIHIAGDPKGYAGVIDERLDLPLIDEMARKRPEWQFVMWRGIFRGRGCSANGAQL